MLLREFLSEIRVLGLPLSDGYDVASFIAGLCYGDVKKNMDLKLDDEKCADALKKLKKKEPAAYITGRREFFGREFHINSSALIPRVETEILMEAVLKETVGKSYKILDLCCGSGCIILSILAENPCITGVGVDISGEAIKVANCNAHKLGLVGRVSFIEADACDFANDGSFSIITCNPPYVTEEEYAVMEENTKYEPKIALVAADNGLYFYKKILDNIAKSNINNGIVFFEIGSEQGAAVSKIAGSFGFEAEILKDLAGNDRVLKIFYN